MNFEADLVPDNTKIADEEALYMEDHVRNELIFHEEYKMCAIRKRCQWQVLIIAGNIRTEFEFLLEE